GPPPPSEIEEEEPLEEEPFSEEVRESIAPPRPSTAAERPPPVRVSSPFDAPASPAASNEPIVILPDVSSDEAEPSEGDLERTAELLETARQRSAELLEDAMSLWWPSRTSGAQAESAMSPPERSGPVATVPASQPRRASPAVPDTTTAKATLTEEPVAPAPTERAQPPPEPRPAPPR